MAILKLRRDFINLVNDANRTDNILSTVRKFESRNGDLDIDAYLSFEKKFYKNLYSKYLDFTREVIKFMSNGYGHLLAWLFFPNLEFTYQKNGCDHNLFDDKLIVALGKGTSFSIDMFDLIISLNGETLEFFLYHFISYTEIYEKGSSFKVTGAPCVSL